MDESGGLPTAAGGNGAVHVMMPLGDPLGSTAFVVDHDTGELVEAATYQPFGGVEADYRPPRWQNFREDVRYTGHRDESQVGLVYFGAHYSPALNRFISPDPMTVHGFAADPNPYAFVGGSPIGNLDSFGLDDPAGTGLLANNAGPSSTVGGILYMAGVSYYTLTGPSGAHIQPEPGEGAQPADHGASPDAAAVAAQHAAVQAAVDTAQNAAQNNSAQAAAQQQAAQQLPAMSAPSCPGNCHTSFPSSPGMTPAQAARAVAEEGFVSWE